ncbi:hypothetical protein AMTR_s00087p00080630 [Amborella trichopoda]|uniref:Uncharacterized protein n=1 Tax=Amborella trichopoda TaxID=13333 RepID=W1P6G1_AMBTC|nr:hypothetical protein AMTR_s00087p00080630 [Amborella trichopoda]
MGIDVNPLPINDPQPSAPPLTTTKVPASDPRGKVAIHTILEESYIIHPSLLIFSCIIPTTLMILRETTSQEPLQDILMPTIQNVQREVVPLETQTWHQDVIISVAQEISNVFTFKNLCYHTKMLK